MSVTEKILEAIRSAVVLSDRVERLTDDLKAHDDMIHNLNERLIRLETVAGMPGSLRPSLPHPP